MTPTLSQHELDLMRDDWQDTVADCLCSIQRNVATGTNPDGHPNIPVWQDHIVNLVCRWADITGTTNTQAEVKGPNINAVIPIALISVPIDTDVTEEDRIKSVALLDGTVICSLGEIQYVQARDPFLNIAVKAWRSG